MFNLSRPKTTRFVRAGMAAIAFTLPILTQADEPQGDSPDDQVTTVSGAELFAREWQANDPRSANGDGLGPVFNGSSCIACHNLGGAGGAGALSKNVDLVTATAFAFQRSNRATTAADVRKPLIKLHPGFANSSTVVLHKFGTSPQRHDTWRLLLASGNQQSRSSGFGQPQSFQPARASFGPPVSSQPGGNSSSDPFAEPPTSRPATIQRTSPLQSTTLPSTPPRATSRQPASTNPRGTFPGPVPAPVPVTPRRNFDPSDSTSQEQQQTSATSPRQPAAAITPQRRPVPPQSDLFGSPNPTPAPTATTAAGAVAQPVNPAPRNTSTALPQLAEAQSVPQVAIPLNTLQQAPFPGATQFPVVNRAIARINQLKSQSRKGLTSSRSVSGAVLQFSQRNTPALFGGGLIDAIPEDVFVAAEKAKFEDYPHVTGRVARDQNGKVGRFGWKSQKPSLEEFTKAACAVELGLEVPGHKQAGVPYDPNHQAKGLDLNAKQLAALIEYLQELPRPIQNKPSDKRAAAVIDEGEELFNSVGCATCHVRKLGDVDGLYGDLLLHDMGPELGGTGSYGSFSPGQLDPAGQQQASQQKIRAVVAAQTEWRTAPLWGVRDSAPYLHDGRATTLEQAIAFHGGESSDSTIKYFMLSASEQQKVQTFLKSLTAPTAKKTVGVKTASR